MSEKRVIRFGRCIEATDFTCDLASEYAFTVEPLQPLFA